MDILPVSSSLPVIQQSRHDDRQQPRKRRPLPVKKDRTVYTSYTPEGHIEEQPAAKIDLVG